MLFFITHIRPNLRFNFCKHSRLEHFQKILCISKLFGSRVVGIEILTMICMQKCQFLANLENWTNVLCLLFMQFNYYRWIFGKHTQFGLSSKYSYNKHCTISYLPCDLSAERSYIQRKAINLVMYLVFSHLFDHEGLLFSA